MAIMIPLLFGSSSRRSVMCLMMSRMKLEMSPLFFLFAPLQAITVLSVVDFVVGREMYLLGCALVLCTLFSALHQV